MAPLLACRADKLHMEAISAYLPLYAWFLHPHCAARCCATQESRTWPVDIRNLSKLATCWHLVGGFTGYYKNLKVPPCQQQQFGINVFHFPLIGSEENHQILLLFKSSGKSPLNEINAGKISLIRCHGVKSCFWKM